MPPKGTSCVTNWYIVGLRRISGIEMCFIGNLGKVKISLIIVR